MRLALYCSHRSCTPARSVKAISIATTALHRLQYYLRPPNHWTPAFLFERGKQNWIDEATGMIDDHHTLSSSSKDPDQLSEVFRRADWIDVSIGLWRFGLERQAVRAIRAAFPDAGFHWRLITLSAKRLLSYPCDPLPMLNR